MRCVSMNQKRQRKDFTDEFKNDAVRLVTEQGYRCNEVGRRLEINHSNISRWVRLHRSQLESGRLQSLRHRLCRLRLCLRLLPCHWQLSKTRRKPS
ncbi:MAG: hypothetical protein C4519_16130, partial [Desulfobacteraceae bacterium]